MNRIRTFAMMTAVATTAACGGTEPSNAPPVSGTEQSNAPPVAAFTAHCEQLQCAFENVSTDEDGTIATYAWDFGDGRTSTDASPTHSYAAPGGDFKVTVAVTDDDGAAVTFSRQVAVSADSLPPADLPPADLPPAAAFSVSCTVLACLFTDQSTDPDAGDSVVSRAWNFGDGHISTTPSPYHTYDAPGGRFTVTLTVTDTHGATATVTEQVDIQEPGTQYIPPPQAGEIAFSRDGKIYRANADGTGLVQLSAGPADSEPAWSRDGSRIAFSRGGEAGGIYVMTADGANPVRRVSAGRSPTWSPDDRWVAFSCGAHDAGAVCKVSADDDGAAPITVLTTTVSVLHPAWSPDGTRIAFSSDWILVDFWLDIWLVSPDGTQATVLRSHDPQPTFDELQPAWSPDGRRIALVTCPLTWSYCDSGALAVMSADGSGLMRLATTSGYAHPTWSPDGQIIAFASANAIEWVTTDGSQRGRIIANGTSPAWRPGS